MVNLDNSIEYLYLFFACLLGNYVLCPIDSEMKRDKIKDLEKIIKPKIKILNKNNVKFFKKKTKPITKEKSPYLIIFTSGTTGKPKGIKISNSSYIGSLFHIKFSGYDSIQILFLPMYYNVEILNTFYSCFFSTKNYLDRKIFVLNIYYFWEKMITKIILYILP